MNGFSGGQPSMESKLSLETSVRHSSRLHLHQISLLMPDEKVSENVLQASQSQSKDFRI